MNVYSIKAQRTRLNREIYIRWLKILEETLHQIPPFLFFLLLKNKNKKSCNPRKRLRRTEESDLNMKQRHA